jgi:hypothetical protein
MCQHDLAGVDVCAWMAFERGAVALHAPGCFGKPGILACDNISSSSPTSYARLRLWRVGTLSSPTGCPRKSSTTVIGDFGENHVLVRFVTVV